MERRIQDPRVELADAATIRGLQERRLLEMVRFAHATNGFYRERWDAAGVDVERIDSIEAFARAIPTVEKKDFVADQLAHPPYGRRLERAFGLGERLEVYTTSGTSGQGVEIHAQTERELAAMVAMYAFLFRWAGLRAGDVTLQTLPITMLGGGRIEWQGAVGYGLTVLPGGNVDVRAKLALVERFRPRALYGSTSYFGHMLAVAEDEVPSASVDVLLTGLEGAGFSYFEQLARGWDAFVADRFGNTQLRCDHMFTCEHGVGTAARPGLLHNLDPFILLEVIDTETGEPVADGEFGEMVVTSLYHWDNPVIRCRLRDGGVWHPGAYCGCGRPFGGVEVASITRTDDVKKVKGVNIYPQAVDDAVFAFAEVDEYRVLLSSDDHLADVATVEVMTKGAARAGFAEELAQRLHHRIGIHVAVRLVDEVPRSEYKARRWHDERVRVIGLEGVAGRAIDAALVDAFCALTGDVDPLHVDEAFAAASPYGARIAPGSLVIALMMAAAVDATGRLDVAVPSVGFDRVRHTAPVLLGDALRADYRVVSFADGRGHADVRVTNQRGETVAVADHVFAVLEDR